tara:strand:- start:51 stop:6131 length:6081 start_codon:yes stop_codon:yes gene_type:complete
MSPLFSNVSTTLDLNGPTLSFVRDPIGQITDVATGKVEFTGIATATFPFDQTSRNTNTGYIKYQWYRNGNALQDNGTTIVGSATTTLSIRGLISPNDDNDQISLVVDYQPSAYQDVDSDGVIDQTGNAINDPIETSAVVLSVLPVISITSQPVNQLVNEFDPDITQGVATDQSDVEATFTVAATTTNIDDPDPSVAADGILLYSWWIEVDGVPFELSRGTPPNFEITNPTFSSITIKKEIPGRHLVYCVVSHTTASPASIQSNKAELEVRPSRGIISYERIGNTNQVISKGNRNLSSAGKLEFQADPEIESNPTLSLPKTPSQNTIVLYAPERDVIAKVTMGGARGEGFGENTGGSGGLSVFKMTFKKNEEYVVRLGVNDTQGFGIVGGSSEFGGGGGGMTALYHKARVIAVCGGGGGAGGSSDFRADGGDGGGVDTDGADGSGQGSGIGGQKFNADTLPSDGNNNNGTAGGILGGCSEGNYYNTQGLTPCTDIATTRIKYVDKDGNEISDSASLIRGYKAGQGYRNNGGDAEVAGGYQGAGGAGARGGNAASGNNAGGGGGSGYQSSEIELLNSFSLDNLGDILLAPRTGRLGGNDDVGFITIEEFVEQPSGEYRIEQPQASQYSTSSIAAVVEKQVDFDIERDSGLESTMTLERIFGLGPETITFGPSTEIMETVLGENALYKFKSISPSQASFNLENNTLQIDGDRDGTYNDLSITPNKGRFFLSQNNVLSYIADWNAPENQAKTLDRPAPDIEFSIDVGSIDRHTDDIAFLSWNVTGYNVTEIFISDDQNPVDKQLGHQFASSTASGTTYSGISTALNPNNTTTYTLTAKNSNGVYASSISESPIQLVVNDQPPVIIDSFTVDDDISTVLNYNNPGRDKKVVNLRWRTIGKVKSMFITDDNGNTYPILDAGSFGTGSFNVIPPVNETTVYTLNIVNLDDISSPVKTVSVDVDKQTAVSIQSFTASDSVYHHPGATAKTVTLSWNITADTTTDPFATNDVKTVVITDNDGNTYATDNSTSGSIIVTPPKSDRGTNVAHPSEPTAGTTDVTTYTLTATNIDDLTTTESLGVTVLNQEHNDVTLSVSPASVQNFQTPNESVTLSWTIAGDYTRFDVINDQTNTVVATSGNSLVIATPLPTNTNTYRIKVYNIDFVKEEKQVSFSVDAQDPNTITLSAVGPTSSSTSATYNNTSAARTFLSWNVGGITSSIKLEKSFNGGAYQTVLASVNASVSNYEIDSPTGTTVYKITAVAGGGVITSSETVTVEVEPQLPVTIALTDVTGRDLATVAGSRVFNSTAVRTSGITNALNWTITGDIKAGNSVVLKDHLGNVKQTYSSNTGSYSIPGADVSTLTPGDVSSKLIYELEVTNLDDVVSTSGKRSYGLNLQPPVNVTLTTPDANILLESIGVSADETTTLTATVSASTAGSADITSLTISGGTGEGNLNNVSVTSGQAITISPKNRKSTYTVTATNLDGKTSKDEQIINVDQNSNDFTFSLRQVFDATGSNSAEIPHDADVANVSFEFNIIGPFSQATAQCRIKDRRQRDRSHLFEQNFFTSSGTFNILDFNEEKTYEVFFFVYNTFGKRGPSKKVTVEVKKQSDPDTEVRYYMHAISRYFKADVGHKFTHSGNPFALSVGDRGRADGVGGKLEVANYFYTFHKKKRPDTIHVAPMVHIDDAGNRYAWKGPGWSDSAGRTNGRLTQRPNYTTPVYEFDTGGRSGFSKFYTIWPPEAYDIRFGFGSHWDYSKDQNGKLAPKFWVYHRNWYWYGNLSFGSQDSRPDINTQLQYQDKLVGTKEWYGDVAFSGPAHRAAKCRAIGYIDLKINADTLGAEPTTIPNINELSLRRHNIPLDALSGGCYPTDHAVLEQTAPQKLTRKFTATTSGTNTIQYLTYKLVSGDGPGTITFRPYAHPITSGSNSGKQIYVADILPGSRYVLEVYYQGQDEAFQLEYGYLFPYKIPGNRDRNSEDSITAEAEDPSGSGKYSQLAIYHFGPIRIVISDAGGGNNRSDTNLAYFTEHGNELIFP